MELFPDIVVRHLPRTVSDHLPLLLHPPKPHQRPVEPRFQVLSSWFTHPHFPDVVRQAWEGDPHHCLLSMNKFQVLAGHWNRHVFGNIFWRKKEYLARLAGIQQKLSYRPSRYLIELEGTLRAELKLTLQQEEEFWRQKSRISWLKGGEQNTRFCHMMTRMR